jgi:phosphotransferase system HPr (HPr) family protein
VTEGAVPEARRTVRLPGREGLHARPAAALARLVGRARGTTLRVRRGEQDADGGSIIDLMTLCAGGGATLELVARGPGAARLVEEAALLLETATE